MTRMMLEKAAKNLAAAHAFAELVVRDWNNNPLEKRAVLLKGCRMFISVSDKKTSDVKAAIEQFPTEADRIAFAAALNDNPCARCALGKAGLDCEVLECRLEQSEVWEEIK